MKRPFARIAGTGRFVPEKVLTNDDFAKTLDTSDEWIRERTGIRERRIAEEHETVAHMSKHACLRALDEAGLGPEDVDGIVGVGGNHAKNPQKGYGQATKPDCLTCHTQENSPKFDYEIYLPKIQHWTRG